MPRDLPGRTDAPGYAPRSVHFLDAVERLGPSREEPEVLDSGPRGLDLGPYAVPVPQADRGHPPRHPSERHQLLAGEGDHVQEEELAAVVVVPTEAAGVSWPWIKSYVRFVAWANALRKV